MRTLVRALEAPARQIAENAVSVGGVMLLAEATMVELEEAAAPAPVEHELM